MPDRDLAQTLADLYAALPQVSAVALSGSRSAGNADRDSDLDLYVYSREEVPLEARAALAQPRARVLELDNRFWEPGDEWIEAESGTRVDVMFRRTDFAEEALESVLERHEAALGYTTALWHNLRNSQVLFDREGWLGRLQERAARPYPEALARAIIAKNAPLLRGTLGAYPKQLALAVKRGDLVAVNHRLAALLASYFDVLFALNLTLHPGEKRLLSLSSRLPLVPPDLAARVEALLAWTPATLSEVPQNVEKLIEALEALLAGHGEEGAVP